MGKCKTKAILADLGTFRHNQAYLGTIQSYLGIFKTLTYSEPEAYAEPWQIHKRGILRTPVYSERWHILKPGLLRTPVCSERWHIKNQRHIQNPFKNVR